MTTAGRDPARPAVLVVGGGNAGICAALSARLAGADVLLAEAGTPDFRGGNSRHTRDIRYVHDDGDEWTTGPYSAEEFLSDLDEVTTGGSNRELGLLLAERSRELPDWMSQRGIKWQGLLSGALHLGRTNGFFLGGGRALLNTYYDTAERLGVRVRYETRLTGASIDRGRCEEVTLEHDGSSMTVAPGAVVFACGGIEANLSWLREEWGPTADGFIVRGSPENDGAGLRVLLDAGGAPVGDARRFHGVAVDARSPRYDGGIVTRVDAVPYGIAVNRTGQRFGDEGETFWPKRYATWGRKIAEQPDQWAAVIFEERMRAQFIPPLYPPLKADTLEELARQLELPVEATVATVRAFNESIHDAPPFRPGELDGRTTVGIEPPKSNWATPIENPPFCAYPLRPGITFCYLGVRADETARMIGSDGRPSSNVFVAGELMAGNILTSGYLAGIGLTIGTVFGRIAGEEAARAADSPG